MSYLLVTPLRKFVLVFLLFVSSLIVIGSPLYNRPWHLKARYEWKRENKLSTRPLQYHVVVRCYSRHVNQPRQFGGEGFPSPHMIEYELFLPLISTFSDLPGVTPNDVIGTFCDDRDSLVLIKLIWIWIYKSSQPIC